MAFFRVPSFFPLLTLKTQVYPESCIFTSNFFNLRFLIFCDGKDCGEIIGEKNHHMVYN